jgi:hypothetical protein
LSIKPFTPIISLADSLALAAAAAGGSGCKKNLSFNGRTKSLASSEFNVPAATTPMWVNIHSWIYFTNSKITKEDY